MTLQAEPPVTFPGEYARHLCRLCLCSREQTARQRLNRIEWYKWPGAEITRLYEQVVGEQLTVSEELSDLHCDACHAWLSGTWRRIAEFKRVSSMWTEFLATESSGDAVADIAEMEEIAEIGDIAEEPQPSQQILKVEIVNVSKAAAAESEDDDQVLVEQVEEEEHIEYMPDGGEFEDEEQHLLDDADDEADKEWFDDEDTTLSTLYVCDICDETLHNQAELRRHFERVHNNNYSEYADDTATAPSTPSPPTPPPAPPVTFQCDICAAQLPDKTAMLRHFDLVHGHRNASAPFACDLCPRTYTCERFLRRHREHKHTGAARQHCRYCKVTFAATDDAHARRMHLRDCAVLAERRQRPRPGGRAPLRCPDCTAGYLRPDTLRRHYETVHRAADWPLVERRMCVRCFRQFGSEEEAVAHRRDVHERWRCPVCSKLCTCAESLERHVRAHSGKERRFRCAECDGTYVTSNQLKIHHRRKHTDERPFECEVEGCGKRYAERSELNVHVKSAHSAQRHACEWCDGTFNSVKYLNEHVAKEHTGDFKYFVCRLCEGGERKFVNTRLLSAHMAVHHAEELVEEDER